MKELKPTVFGDLIAMNALYRPGPLEYIPSFVRRKNGEEAIEYDLPAMEEYLAETYGITVYQEQVMLLSQKLAGFSKGDADVLRKAMGKKLIDVLEKMKSKFIEGAVKKGHPEDKLEKIWKDWTAFAQYAFNKSHSTCYAWIAYQTAYLKAHYPAEYMAAVLSNNMNDIKQVSFFLEECKRMGLEVLGPDVNESFHKFTVNKDNAIRFGMGAIKGVGKGAVDTIVENRKTSPYRSVFDMAKRIDLRSANKKAFENIALAGGFDSFEDTHRAQYFHDEGDGITFLEKALRYGAKMQENENSAQVSLFGEMSEVQIPEPVVPPCDTWGTMYKLKREKEVVGIYISGHPLDDFKTEIKYFCNASLSDLRELTRLVNREVSIAGVITDIQHRTSKNGKGGAAFTVEDYNDSYEFRLFNEDYLKFRHFLLINSFIYLRLYVREGFIKKETGERSEPRLQYNTMMQLQDVMQQFAKKITIHLNVEDIKPNKIDVLKQAVRDHGGEHQLYFSVYKLDEDVKLTMQSRKLKVNINSDLIDILRSQDFIFKLN